MVKVADVDAALLVLELKVEQGDKVRSTTSGAEKSERRDAGDDAAVDVEGSARSTLHGSGLTDKQEAKSSRQPEPRQRGAAASEFKAQRDICSATSLQLSGLSHSSASPFWHLTHSITCKCE